jgi:diguanylate cyclase (GGDEF)-like protein/PAS domain S-box-containing protein
MRHTFTSVGLSVTGVPNDAARVIAIPSGRPHSHEVVAPPRAVVSDLARLRMLSRIAEQVGEGVVFADNDGWFQYVNSEFARQHAGTVEELTGAHLSSFYSAEDLATQVQPIIAAALEHGIGRGEVTRLRRDGTHFPARITLSLLHDDAGALIGRVLCVQDITAQRSLEQSLREAALYDPLTRLPNRRLLRDRVEHALVLRARRHTGVAVLFVDLDGFKRVNDTFGHDVGDEVLVEVARRLVERGRGCDTLARYGGDEFVMLVEELVDGEQAVSVGERALAGFQEPVRTVVGDIAVSASIGVYLATDEDDYDSLLRAADAAMYDAKRSGQGGIRCSPGSPGPRRMTTAATRPR